MDNLTSTAIDIVDGLMLRDTFAMLAFYDARISAESDVVWPALIMHGCNGYRLSYPRFVQHQ